MRESQKANKWMPGFIYKINHGNYYYNEKYIIIHHIIAALDYSMEGRGKYRNNE